MKNKNFSKKKILRKLKYIKDPRGDLSVGNFSKNIPFRPKRFFIFKISKKTVRGEHAHIKCHQFIICLHGNFKIDVSNSKTKKKIYLNSPKLGCYIPPMFWAKLHSFSKDTIAIVFASHLYDEKDYIRNYKDYLKYILKKSDKY